ncbi:hypothetical protein ACNKHR_09760 [Shigella flexneri]
MVKNPNAPCRWPPCWAPRWPVSLHRCDPGDCGNVSSSQMAASGTPFAVSASTILGGWAAPMVSPSPPLPA